METYDEVYMISEAVAFWIPSHSCLGKGGNFEKPIGHVRHITRVIGCSKNPPLRTTSQILAFAQTSIQNPNILGSCSI